MLESDLKRIVLNLFESFYLKDFGLSLDNDKCPGFPLDRSVCDSLKLMKDVEG